MIAARFDRPQLAGVMAAVSVGAFIPYLALQMKDIFFVVVAVLGNPPALKAGDPRCSFFMMRSEFCAERGLRVFDPGSRFYQYRHKRDCVGMV